PPHGHAAHAIAGADLSLALQSAGARVVTETDALPQLRRHQREPWTCHESVLYRKDQPAVGLMQQESRLPSASARRASSLRATRNNVKLSPAATSNSTLAHCRATWGSADGSK